MINKIVRILPVIILNLSATDFLSCQEKANDDEQIQLWNVSSGAQYYSRYTNYGIDLSQDRSAFSLESEISHHSGLSAGIQAFAITGTDGGYEHSSFHAGYEYLLNKALSAKGTSTLPII